MAETGVWGPCVLPTHVRSTAASTVDADIMLSMTSAVARHCISPRCCWYTALHSRRKAVEDHSLADDLSSVPAPAAAALVRVRARPHSRPCRAAAGSTGPSGICDPPPAPMLRLLYSCTWCDRCRGTQGSWALWALTFYNPHLGLPLRERRHLETLRVGAIATFWCVSWRNGSA